MGLNKRLIGAGATASGALTPSENFKAVTWTGNDADGRAIEVGFKPDLVWIKSRTIASSNRWFDSTRGATKFIISDSTGAEQTASNTLQSFSNTGFTVGVSSGVNDSSSTYVAWCWKANGGTTSSNTDGTITSTVQANTAAGFSIVTWTGNGSAGATVGHGLGVAPDYIILKNRTRAGYGWYVLTSTGATHNMVLNTTDGQATSTAAWNDTQPTSTVFSLGSDTGPNSANYPYVGYCFSNIDGFSKAGTYTGNGSANGPIVETGFEPAFIMIKSTAGGQDWRLYDNKRNASNPRNCYLSANNSNVEECQYDQVDFLSNGFKVIGTDGSLNGNGITITYLAFAADPDTEAPTLASSFDVETYNMTGGSDYDLSFPFKPQFVVTKTRDEAAHWSWGDIIRGNNSNLSSNDNNEVNTTNQWRVKDWYAGATSVTIAQHASTNTSNVSYAWKADDNEATIEEVVEDLDAVAVYKFEDNVNDVTSTYNGTATDITYNSSGKFNKSAIFNGSSSKVAVGNWGLTSNRDFSISMWIKGDDWSGDQYVYGQGANAGNFDAMSVFVRSNSTVYHDNRGSADSFTTSLSLSTGTWYHWVHTYNSSNGLHTLYINGSSVGTATRTLDLQSNNSGGAIGTREIAGSYHFDGEIDQFRVYQKTLTTTNVATLYAETAAQNDSLNLGMTYTASIQSIVSANANAGFSIVKYAGTQISGTKVPHGLSAAPDMIIIKRLNGGAGFNWIVGHSSLDFTQNQSLILDGTGAVTTDPYWNATAPSATTFTLGVGSNTGSTNDNAGNYIAYCFHDVTGYQKFGSYTGDGTTTKTITTGFQPDFVMIKVTSQSDNWVILDSVRSGSKNIKPNSSVVEATESGTNVEFLSTGFKLIGSGPGLGQTNGSGKSYIYWAVAKNVPSNTTLANSFKVVTYTGNGSTQSITGTGFTPDFVWIKQRSGTQDQMWYDNNRGAGNYISSNNTNAQGYANSTLTSFDTDGFSVGSSNSENQSGQTFVAWAWKAGNTWQSNVTGAIPSTTNTNTANGFSIVKYTGTGANTTVGHNLGAAPEVMIIKDLDNTRDWAVYHIGNTGSSGYANQERLKLNTNGATFTYAPYWNGTTPTSTVFSLGNEGNVNTSGQDYIAYCWHSVSGYSKFGSYAGGSTGSGNVITTGFQPDWIMIKRTDTADDWTIIDSVRGDGTSSKRLIANTNGAEKTATSIWFPTSTGFYFSGTGASYNSSGGTYIYMAFKMN